MWFCMFFAIKYRLVANKLFVWYQLCVRFWLFLPISSFTTQDSVECRTKSLKSLVSSSYSQHAPTWQEASIKSPFPPLLIIIWSLHPDTKQPWGCATAKVRPSTKLQGNNGEALCVKGLGGPSRCVKSFQSFNQHRKNQQIKHHFSVESAISQQSSKAEVCVLPPKTWLRNKDGSISVFTFVCVCVSFFVETSKSGKHGWWQVNGPVLFPNWYSSWGCIGTQFNMTWFSCCSSRIKSATLGTIAKSRSTLGTHRHTILDQLYTWNYTIHFLTRTPLRNQSQNLSLPEVPCYSCSLVVSSTLQI